jgi:hypothetical protein
MAIKMNVVECELGNYIHYWRGLPKTGKTTLFRDLVLELYKDPAKGLLVVFGNELGHKSLDQLQFEEITAWDAMEDADGNRGFVQLVDDLVRNNKNYGIKLIAFDTIDKMIEVATEEVKRQSTIETGKVCTSINSAFGGYGRGKEALKALIYEQLGRLTAIGLYPIVIGHSKKKEKTDEYTGDSFETITGSLTADYDAIFGDIAQINMMVTVDRNIVDGKVAGAVTNMWFRSNGIVDAGSRFEGMPEKMELSAKNYIKAFNTGVEASKKSKTNNPVDAVAESAPVAEAGLDEEPEIDVAALKKELSAAIKDGTVAKVTYMSELESRGYKKITEATPEDVLAIKIALLG